MSQSQLLLLLILNCPLHPPFFYSPPNLPPNLPPYQPSHVLYGRPFLCFTLVSSLILLSFANFSATILVFSYSSFPLPFMYRRVTVYRLSHHSQAHRFLLPIFFLSSPASSPLSAPPFCLSAPFLLPKFLPTRYVPGFLKITPTPKF